METDSSSEEPTSSLSALSQSFRKRRVDLIALVSYCNAARQYYDHGPLAGRYRVLLQPWTQSLGAERHITRMSVV